VSRRWISSDAIRRSRKAEDAKATEDAVVKAPIARALATLVALALTTMPSPRPAFAAAEEAIAAIRPALAFVYLPLTQETGSGVIVHTETGVTYVLTAAHVVRAGGEIQLYFNNDVAHPHTATVVKVDSADDLALLRTDVSAPAQASFSESVTSGMRIAVLGYPAQTSLRLLSKTGELQPEASVGDTTSVRLHGALLSTTAYTEPGDSGAPIFRQDDAEVVGIVTGHFGPSNRAGFQATGVSAVRHFLESSHVVFYGAQGAQGRGAHWNSAYRAVIGLRPLREVRGAHRLLADYVLDIAVDQSGRSLFSLNDSRGGAIFQIQSANGPAVSQFVTRLLSRVQGAVGRTFESSLSRPSMSLRNVVSLSELGEDAFQKGYVGGIREMLTIHEDSNPLLNNLSVSFDITIVDKYGDAVFSGNAARSVHQPIVAIPELQLETMTDALVDSAVSALRSEAQAGTDAGVNFARFGIPIATGQRGALFTVAADTRGSRVVSLFPYGTAARAQLQADDEIVALDGQDLANLPSAQIEALFDQHHGSLYRLTVLEPDGQPVIISFSAEDLRWYLEHPLRPDR
jgi:S1-C subfamily serine protease